MQFDLLPGNQRSISHYCPGCITVNGQDYEDNVLIGLETIECPWAVQSLEQIDAATLCTDQPIEIAIIGCGEQPVHAPAQLQAAFAQHRVGLEVMTNDAACRTFNILSAEGRQVILGLLLR